MKASKIIAFILGLLCSLTSHAVDYDAMYADIDNIKQQITKNKNSVSNLSNLKRRLKPYILELNQCQQANNALIERLNKENEYINHPSQYKYFQEEKKRFDQELESIKAKNAKCGFLLTKISFLKNEIGNYNFYNFRNEFFFRSNPFWSMDILDNVNFSKHPKAYLYKYLANETNIPRLLFTANFIFLLVLTLKCFSYTSYRLFSKLRVLNIERFFLAYILFCLSGPIQFLLIKNIYEHSDLTIIGFFGRRLVVLIAITIIHYFYKYIEIKNRFLSFLGVFLFFLSNYCSLRSVMELKYLLENAALDYQILSIKYIQLWCLQFQFVFLSYWLLVKALHLNIVQNKNLFRIGSGVLVFILIVGLYGYVDMAIEIDLTLILIMIFVVWTIITFHAFNNINHYFKNIPKKDGLLIQSLFGHFIKKAIFCFNCLTFSFVFFTGALLLIVVIFSLPFLFTAEQVNRFFTNFYIPVHGSFTNIDILLFLKSFVLFQILNLLSYIISFNLAKKILKNKDTVEKTANLFYFLCLVLSIVLVLYFLGIDLVNFIILLGGFSFGIGLGLKNVLSSIISSIILFVNRPYEIGDYIEVNQTKGFVKKITLLETMIETLDNNTLILPNQMLASSVIQNINYAKKTSCNIHLKYLLIHFEIEQDDNVKEKICSILSRNENVLYSGPNSVKFLFTPVVQSAEDMNLEIVFSVKSLKQLQENLSILNRQILKKLKEMQLEVKFEEIQHPLE